MAPRIRLLLAFGLGLACQPTQGETTSFASVPTTAPPPSGSDSSAADTSGGSDGGASQGSSGGGASDASSSADPSVGTGDTTLLYDVGPDTDTATGSDTKPAGCEGKIDLLFVLSRDASMKSSQEKLLAAFPGFIATIQAKFADFDYHIMVVDGDTEWGLITCDLACAMEGFCGGVPDYPCDLLHLVTDCDRTIGAGNVFAAGGNASNKPCQIAGGRRYLTNEQPNLAETFACVARLGVSGRDLMGQALSAAMKPEMNAPGGCNAGFLRDDALLMVTFLGGYDYDSKGNPDLWADRVLSAKGGDPGAVVMLSILNPDCPAPDRICELVKKIPVPHGCGRQPGLR
ncbi:MAG: hypothetical protein IPK80_35110 [Nannocystis sp.]|nr:hypothetical protein [Nannocystis sp.]